MAPDDSSSSPPTSEEESQTRELSSSQVQLPYSHNNALSPKVSMLQPPPPPLSTANSILLWRRTMLQSRSPLATNSHDLQPYGINSLPLPQGLGPQEKPANGINDLISFIVSRDMDGIHQDPPLPAASTDLASLIELLSGMWQDSCTGQDFLHTIIIPFLVSVFPPHTNAQPLRLADSSSDSYGSESVSSSEEATGPAVNNVPHRMIYSQFPPDDDDPIYDIWVGPPPGYYKLNVAVTSIAAGGAYTLGMGAVIRDHSGVARIAITLFFNNLNPALAAEYLIYNLGIAISFYLGFRMIIAETESSWLVEHIRALGQLPRLHYSHFNYFHARRVNRNANNAAHMFASEAALRGRRNIFWSAQNIVNVFGTNVMPF